MKTLVRDVARIVLASTIVGGLGVAVSGMALGWPGMSSAIVGTAIAAGVGILVILYLHWKGLSIKSVLIGAGLRFGVTLLVAGWVAWANEDFRNLGYFLTLSTVYMANLYLETQFAVEGLKKKSIPAVI